MTAGYVGEQATLASLFWSETKDSETDQDRDREAAQAAAKEHQAMKSKRRASDGEDEAYPRHYAHHRTVIEEVCLPLDMFPSSRDLVSIVGDTILGAYAPSIVLLLGLREYFQRMLMQSNYSRKYHHQQRCCESPVRPQLRRGLGCEVGRPHDGLGTLEARGHYPWRTSSTTATTRGE